MSLSRSRRQQLMGGVPALLLLVALGLTTNNTASGGSGPLDAPTAGPGEGRLTLAGGPFPWPAEGQGAVEVDGMPLGSWGDQRPVPIASLTKVMTAYVVLRDHPLGPGEPGPQIEADSEAAHEVGVGDESTVPVRAGEKYSERKLLEMLLIPSGNNIARLLARWDAGSQEAFVRKMQRSAKELGMDHTTYTGASGVEPTTRSTASDQLKLARQAMKDPVFRAVVASRTVAVPGAGSLANTNTLLGTSGVVGLKTGSSTPAGGNLLWASEARVGGRTRLLLGAVLHQRANTSAAEGLRAALENSKVLIDRLRDRLTTARTEG
ncbi:D-alanyl-D-alanine carboxypeptidase family protein [Peterkaempfera griseoplana]|uniref:D-alanyl-D-alanine carboxypeptidase family protein n=1 Tax=Peterkaempfera griseoplana TaxID=66896 RepID=UPI0006E421EB|nr:serine hydrolase [Peterkaempfera griseoplana]